MDNLFGGMFGKIAPGMCRLSMNGEIAVKTSSGYKSINADTGRLTNCNNFVFDIGEEFFFLVPTNKVAKGDIILVNGKPKCVLEAEKNRITAISYEDSTVEQIIPERMVFLGNTYLYGKVVSMFGKRGLGKGGGKLFKYMMLSEMMKGSSKGEGGVNALLPLFLLGGKGEGGFMDGIFDFDFDDGEDIDLEEETEDILV